MTIVEFIATGSVGGAEVYSLRLGEFLRSQGHRVIFIVRRDTMLRHEIEKRGFEAKFWPLPKRKGKRDVRTFIRLSWLLRRERVDVLHTHLSYANTLGGFTGRTWRIPVVAHAHATDSAKPYRYAPFIAAVAGAVRDHLASQGVAQERLHVLYNGVPLEGLEPVTPEERSAARQRYNLAPETPVAVVLANLRERKGHRFLIEAMAQLSRDNAGRAAKIEVIFAGEGREMEPLKKLARDLGLEKRVHFLGFTHDAAGVLAASDVMVLPSSKEGLSIAVTEAMARGIPVISTNVAGLPEVVRDGQTGLLVPPENVPALAVALKRRFDDDDEAQRMAVAARQLVESEFEETLCLSRFEAFLRQVVESYPAPVPRTI